MGSRVGGMMFRVCAAVALLAGCGAGRLAAQERRVDQYGSAPARIESLCQALAPGDRAAVDHLRGTMSGKLDDFAPDSLWRTYGCALARLHVAAAAEPRGVLARKYALPALEAFMHVLDHAPGDVVASTGLATLGFEISEGPEPDAILRYAYHFATYGYAAAHAGVDVPIVLRLCTEFALVMGTTARAHYCNHRALALGVDSTWHLVRSMWMDMLNGDLDRATRSFDRAIASAHDSVQLAEAAFRARGVVDEATGRAGIVAAWSGMSDSTRVQWVHDHADGKASATRSVFGDALVRAEGGLTAHGPVFLACPFLIIRNGFAMSGSIRNCEPPIGDRTHFLTTRTAILRFWDPLTGAPKALLTYALDRSQNGIEVDIKGHAEARLRLQVWEWERQRWLDTTIQIQATSSNELPMPPFISSAIEIPAPGGTYSWITTIQQSSHPPGRAGRSSYEAAKSPSDTGLAISDLVLGVAKQKLTWRIGSDTVTLSPWNYLLGGEPVDLFFQVRNPGPEEELSVQLELKAIVGGVIADAPELAIKFPLRVVKGINGINRQLDISKLTEASHRLSIQILDRAGRVVAQKSTNLLVR
jgi:hypothetical protein